MYPDCDREMFDYILFTNVSANGHFCNGKHFWDEDVNKAVEQWDRMRGVTTQADREAFEAWKKQRREYLNEIAKVAPTFLNFIQ